MFESDSESVKETPYHIYLYNINTEERFFFFFTFWMRQFN